MYAKADKQKEPQQHYISVVTHMHVLITVVHIHILHNFIT